MWQTRLSPDAAQAVRELAERCAATDGVNPLNEDAHFALTDDSSRHLFAELSEAESAPDASAAGGRGVSTTSAPATLRTDSGLARATASSDKSVAGYLQWQPQFGTAQLMVDPGQRRCGVGSSLLAELSATAQPRLWAFGDLPAARGFAAHHGLAPERSLLMMTRALTSVQPPEVPDGVTLRGYTDADAAELLAVNAAAFAHHPEQGSLDAEALARRVAEPWFDPQGLILAFDEAGLAGFHWTKAEHGVGEVYVVGVAPRAQGRGYGRLLLDAGISHLAGKDLPTVELYVDAADQIAVRMYERAGFAEAHRDVLYASTPQE